MDVSKLWKGRRFGSAALGLQSTQEVSCAAGEFMAVNNCQGASNRSPGELHGWEKPTETIVSKSVCKSQETSSVVPAGTRHPL